MNGLMHIYCDESCHLERDHQPAMVLGAISCPAATRKHIADRVKKLKREHGVQSRREIKWTQVSPSTLRFYRSLIDLFFNEKEANFRAVVVPDKSILDHERYSQTHDDFYYKMWWQLLTRLIDDEHHFRIFVDIKDTHSSIKLRKLHDVLCNTHYDFDSDRIRTIEAVRSHDVPLVQLTDLLTGALSHHFRSINGSPAKAALIEHMQRRSGLTFMRSTLPAVRKFDLFIWRSQDAE